MFHSKFIITFFLGQVYNYLNVSLRAFNHLILRNLFQVMDPVDSREGIHLISIYTHPWLIKFRTNCFSLKFLSDHGLFWYQLWRWRSEFTSHGTWTFFKSLWSKYEPASVYPSVYDFCYWCIFCSDDSLTKRFMHFRLQFNYNVVFIDFDSYFLLSILFFIAMSHLVHLRSCNLSLLW